MVDYRTFLKDELQRRKTTNPRYSLRAFAKFLELSPGTLSRVIAGKRPLSEASANRVVSKCESNKVVRETSQEIVVERATGTHNH